MTWVTVAEAATITGKSKRTIWRIIKAHNLTTSRERGEVETFVNLYDIRKAVTRSIRT